MTGSLVAELEIRPSGDADDVDAVDVLPAIESRTRDGGVVVMGSSLSRGWRWLVPR